MDRLSVVVASQYHYRGNKERGKILIPSHSIQLLLQFHAPSNANTRYPLPPKKRLFRISPLFSLPETVEKEKTGRRSMIFKIFFFLAKTCPAIILKKL